jgi:hypothetical protein
MTGTCSQIHFLQEKAVNADERRRAGAKTLIA